ncbi:uncharacterized protein LOC117653624 isoform X1 [Thrips palmi]|uniref:Uncharacterized protein LOC117653624 isoform X1 n=1 Tax=Thrips palmi TaxID=161013 RepID=A0A6P9ADD0_THRPL|nr:uncharacterized protein LOC117653624 isoform X1 [Thrips palmi]
MTAVAGVLLLVGVVLAVAEAAPQDLVPQDPMAAPLSPMDDAKARVEIVMVTESPAEAIQEAIRYNPDVAAALQSNTTNLYLLKSVTYTNGTAEDLGLPKEELLPEGAPDRVRVADKILYSSGNNNTSPASPEVAEGQAQQPVEGIHATVQLVPVPIN